MRATPSWWWRDFLPLAMLLVAALACAAEADTPIQKEGRALTLQFQRGETAAVFARMTPPMRETAGSAEDLKRFRAQVLAEAGPEQTVLSEGEVVVGPYRTYRRLARHTRADRPILTEWVFDGDLAIVGFIMKPDPVPAPSQYLAYQTHARLRLPFDGAWYVFWGGRTVEQNYHAVVRDQRFAYDFVVITAGRTHDGDGSKVDNYYCWDRPVRAPSSATVVAAVDDFPDNVPGRTDPAHPVGNHVILDLGEGEFAVLAHLKNGSVRVAKGQRVERGAEIGRCGNSGNTTEPHLHFHLQDGAKFGAAEGLPAFFTNYVADGERIARGEPLRGQTVANATDSAAQ
jgi:murein DD-endopeptidase MepM/ murein hydrolase activator NlpD